VRDPYFRRFGTPADELRQALADIRERAKHFADGEVEELRRNVSDATARLAEIEEERASIQELIPQYLAALAALGEPDVAPQ